MTQHIQPVDQIDFAPSEIFRHAMRCVASPVALVTTQLNGQRAGLTATAICSATTEPPTILVCVNRNASAEPLIAASGILGVSFLSVGQHGVARAFSTSGMSAEERFSGAEWHQEATKVPLLKGAVAAFDCRIASVVPCGTHSIFVSQVLWASHTPTEKPLLYRDGFFRRLDETS